MMIKNKGIPGILMLLIAGTTILLYAFSTGITGRTLKNGEGCTCHGVSSPGVSVVISGPDTLLPDQTAEYSVTITGGPLVRGGTNIAASSGTLAPVSNDLQIIGGELTHVAPKAPSGSAVTFQFTYTAPSAAGAQTLYANGNSVNFNGNNTGDNWNFASNKTVTVTTVTGVDEQAAVAGYELKQNYPNPFNPSTVISFNLADPVNVELSIYNSLGQKVQELFSGFMESGSHSLQFNGAGMASGIYYYKLVTGKFTDVKKMMLVK